RVSVLPMLAGGAHTLRAEGSQGRYTSEATFIVLPHLEVVPASMTAGVEASIHGTGFAPGEQISLTLGSGGTFATTSTNEHGALGAPRVGPAGDTTSGWAPSPTGSRSGVVGNALAQATGPGRTGSNPWYLASTGPAGAFKAHRAVWNPTHGPWWAR